DYSPSNITWMPDGKSILFTMSIPKQNESWGVESQVNRFRPRGASWTEAPRIVEALAYRRDRQGFTNDNVSQLFIVPADGGTARQLTFDEYGVNGIELTPDGRTVLFSSRPRIPDADYEWRQSDIYAVDLATGQIRQITNRSGTETNPTVSPDGRLVAYTGYEFNTDTYRDTRLYVMNIDGSNQRVLTEELDRSPGNLIWAKDGSGIYFTVQDRGAQNLYFVNLNGDIRQITEGKHLIDVSDIREDGLAIGTLTDPHKPGDIITFNVRRPNQIRQLTDVNADVLAGKKLGEHEEIRSEEHTSELQSRENL